MRSLVSLFIVIFCIFLGTGCKTVVKNSDPSEESDSGSDFDGEFFACAKLETGHCPAVLSDVEVPNGTNKIYLTWQLKHSSKERVLQCISCKLMNTDTMESGGLLGCRIDNYLLGVVSDSPKSYTNLLTFNSALKKGNYRATVKCGLPKDSPVKVDALIDIVVK